MTALWRISRHRDLDGLGGLRAPGRWHQRGLPVVYLAENPAGALLEVCVHTAANDVPPSYLLQEIRVPANVVVENFETNSLPDDWTENVEPTRTIGSNWLRSGRSALLRIPSVIVPETYNVLLNPVHPRARHVEVIRALAYPFNVRLKR